jgi:thiol-disulfide isomerase/thioredoxin/DNA-directed RNA polymerase subunit F
MIALSLAFGAALLFSLDVAALRSGDKATPFKVEKWLLNGPVELKVDTESPNAHHKLFVLELWGTWSPPCRQAVPLLIYLQNKYRDKGLQIIAVSRESEKVIADFLKKHPDINYAVAADKASQTTLKYLGQSRLLPRIYIIDAEKEIIWVGEVADLAVTLEKIYSGKFNKYNQKRIAQLQDELEVHMRRNDLRSVEAISDKILDLEPDNGAALRMRMFMYENFRLTDKGWKFLEQLNNKIPDNRRLYFSMLDYISRYPQYSKAVPNIAKKFIKRFSKQPDQLNTLAWMLLSRFQFQPGVLEPAAEAVELAMKQVDKNNKARYGAFLSTKALLLYRTGLLEQAIKTQKEASALLSGVSKQESKKAELLFSEALKLRKKLSKPVMKK